RSSDEGCVDSHTDGQWIVHGRARIAEFLGKLYEKFGDAVDEVVDGAVRAPELFEMFAAEERLIADVEAHHGKRPAGLKNNLCGLGVVVDVGLGRCIDVAALDGATHDDNFFY